MGGHARRQPSGRLCLGLLVAIAALFALIPAARASADFTLTVNVEGEGEVWCEGEGEVGEEIEFYSEDCTNAKLEYPAGTEVFLEAFEEAGWEFAGFSGDCSGLVCELTMDEDHEVTAIFKFEGNENTLSIATAGTGSGQVECELEEGPEPCKAIYPEETEFALTEVILIPVADEGSEFAGFSGDCSGLVCELTMDEDHEVTATFDLVAGKEETGGGSSGEIVSVAPLPLGKVHVGGAALYKRGRAMVRLTCKGPGRCAGKVKLFAKLKRGKGRARRVQIGKVAFGLPAGSSRTVKIKLSRPARKLLRKGRTVVAKAGGPGVARSKLRIKPTFR